MISVRSSNTQMPGNRAIRSTCGKLTLQEYLPGYRYGPFLRHLARLYNVPLDSILDIGCGSGKRTVELTAVARRVVGVDMSAAMLAKALAKNQNGCSFVEGDLWLSPLEETFNIITPSTNAPNHIQEIK